MNTAKNHLVASNRRPPTGDIDIADAEQFDSGIRLRDNDTPERELMRQQMEQTVMRAVEALPAELREAIDQELRPLLDGPGDQTQDDMHQGDTEQ